MCTLLLALVILQADRGEGQVVGLPVAPRSTLDGWSVHGTVAFPGEELGSGTAVAAGAATQLGSIGLELNVTADWPEGGQGDGAGASVLASVTPIRDVTSPFRLRIFGGIGGWYSNRSSGDAEWQDGESNVVGGASFSFVLPTPVVSLAPWIAPRINFVSGPEDLAYHGTHAALAAGIDAAVLQGIGLRAAYDRIFIDGADATTFAIALYYSFRPGF